MLQQGEPLCKHLRPACSTRLAVCCGCCRNGPTFGGRQGWGAPPGHRGRLRWRAGDGGGWEVRLRALKPAVVQSTTAKHTFSYVSYRLDLMAIATATTAAVPLADAPSAAAAAAAAAAAGTAAAAAVRAAGIPVDLEFAAAAAFAASSGSPASNRGLGRISSP